MNYSNMTADECGALANAIVLQAIDDYEMAISVLSTEYHPETPEQELNMISKKVYGKKMKYDCEKFFNSEWYKNLTTVPAEIIVNNILDGIKNAKNVIYNDKEKKYLCTCGCKLGVLKGGVGRPVIKCRICKKYWRVFGEPVEME